MATLYLVEQNSILRKQGDRLLVCHRPPASRRYSAVLQSDIIRDLPVTDVDHIMLFGNIQVTTSALHLLLEKGVELAIHSQGGRLLGQLTPPMGKNIPLRRQQFRRADDPEFALDISRQIVRVKIANCQGFLRRFQANHPGCFSHAELDYFSEAVSRSQSAGSLETLRGVEGAAAAQYFKLLGNMILPPWSFSGRKKRPPGDPVNAVLSFGYVIVGSQLQSLLDGIGLDPYLGFYHQEEYGRPSLALDLLEEFRHPLIDQLAIMLFNQNIMQESDFYNPPGGGVYMTAPGKKKFFTHYEKMLGEISIEENLPGRKGYFPVFQRQIQRLVRSIQENITYEPYIIGN